jgi:predicted ATPase
MIGHRIMGMSLLNTGDIVEGRAHLDRAITLYEPAKHIPLATRFGQDIAVTILSWRSFALWLLGYPDAALADADNCLKHARKVGQAATLMYALATMPLTSITCGHYAATSAELDELVALAEEKGALFFKAVGMGTQGLLFSLTGRTSEAVRTLTSAVSAYRSTGAKFCLSWHLSNLANACASLGQFGDAERWIVEALETIETTKEKMFEPEVNRTAGEIAFKSPERDTTKAQAYFERALAVARAQQAKSWELRSSMSLARLGRDQGKVEQARELLAPVYGWFTEGFDTRDLKEAKALLADLA